MTSGIVQQLMIIVAAALILLAIVLVVRSVRTPTPPASELWAKANAIDLGPTTRPVVDLYLGTSKVLRRIGAFGGIVIPPAITAGTGIDLHTSAVVWILLGYLGGQVVAELTLARVPAAEHRSASLGTRRLIAYLPRPLVLTQLALPVVSAGLGLAVVLLAGDGPGTDSSASFDAARSAALVSGPLAVVLAIGAVLGERALVRRPQPIVEPELVRLDDAMRSSSVRTVAATSVAITALLISSQLAAIAYSLEPSAAQGWLWAATSVILLLAYCSWQWWVNRGWRVQRSTTSLVSGART